MAQKDVPLSDTQLRARIRGCWIGKAVGGTLGQPWEGHRRPLNLTFYQPVPTEMIPNDDLDLQVVWAAVLDRMDTPRVDRHALAQAWLDHVQFPWDEYGVALRNLRNGLKAPQTGSFDNWFTQGMGAAIRSEIWACLAAGDPKLAAAYAYEDACVDHADEGIHAEVFFAAIESAAFIEHNRDRLIDIGLAAIPETSLTYRAVIDTRQWWAQQPNWLAVRERILDRYGSDNFTDSVMNIGFIILGWLAGDGDFGESICIANNCGMDTDCTAATLGAILGIIDPDSIDARWTDPIGDKLVLNKGIVGIDHPDTLDGFTDLILDLRHRLDGRPPAPEDLTQSTEHLAIPVRMGFVPSLDDTETRLPPAGAPEPTLPPSAVSTTLPGTYARLLAHEFEDEVLLLRYTLTLEEPRDVRIMFNCPQANRVWIDGVYRFGRDHGPMVPAPHRAPADQFVNLSLGAGVHTLTAAVRRPSNGRGVQWVVGVVDQKTYQWLPDVLFQKKAEPALSPIASKR
ncbi:MAG TPA: ADP-ribosylglycohydrolase family protein [Phycisphaeraceae bacterium]